MKEVIKTPGLQTWETCRTTDRHILQLEREPAGKDDRSGLGHPEFQAMAKQSKENVNQRQKSQVRTEAVSGPPPIRGQTSNSSSNYTPVKINLKKLILKEKTKPKKLQNPIHLALHLTMTLILNSWESMVIALYDVVLKILESPLTPKVLHLPFIKALSFINLIKLNLSFP